MITGGTAGGPNGTAAGDGIDGSNLMIIDTGTISKGGAGANAITFTGGANFLNLNDGTAGTLVGDVAVTGSLTFDQSAAVTLTI